MPAYWLMYIMNALERNAVKYAVRDRRTDKAQLLEYNYLAPDSVNEIFDGLKIMREAVARAWAVKNKKTVKDKDLEKTGRDLLNKNTAGIDDLEILLQG